MSHPAVTASVSPIPVVCDPRVFTKEERASHLALVEDVLIRWPSRRSELEDGFLFEYQGDEERFLAIARWAAAEHRCCSWASFSIEMTPFAAGQQGLISLRYRGGSAGKEALVEALRVFESGEMNVEAFLDGGKLTVDNFRSAAPEQKTPVQRKGGCGC